MYTVQVGRQFLELYNRKTGRNLSALEFFEEEFFPVLFDSEDYLHLMQVHNSPFFQRISKKDQNPNIRDALIKKNKLLAKIEEYANGNDNLGGNIAVGFKAKEDIKSTSGQVSNILKGPSEEEVLYSWFGGALGAGFGGGYDFLFNNEKILWFIYQGWKYYRQYLDESPKAKGRQIETWNGLWITFGLEYRDDLEKAYRRTLEQASDYSGSQGGYIKLIRPEWSEQIFSLARHLGDDNLQELVYGYSYGQMNKTLGFLYLELNNVRRMPDIFEQLIQADSSLSRSEIKKLEEVYQAQFTLEKACALGGIGVKALQPKDLYKYTAGDVLQKKKASLKLEKEEKRLTFITYLTWIQAMLNNKETLQLAEEVADSLLTYEGREKRLRTRIKAVENLWEASNRQQFIDKLAAIIEDEPMVAETVNKAVNQLMSNKIPQDMYRLFLTLIKFKYHYYQSN
ncbi:MAG TPA: hypothetical protein VF181_12705 [Balneolaceae bacterium]